MCVCVCCADNLPTYPTRDLRAANDLKKQGGGRGSENSNPERSSSKHTCFALFESGSDEF